MRQQKVLIAEDDPVSAALLAKIVEADGYQAVAAKNGKEALDLYGKDTFFAVIVDLQMPVMSGHELIDRLKETGTNPLIIVQTVNSELRTAIETMKKGVYDYIPKPINREELLLKLRHAQDQARLRELEQALERESEIRIKHQLAFNVWKENVVSRDLDRFDRNLFSNLRRSFSQGAGFGLLLSLISMIGREARMEDNNCVISKDLMNLVQTNADVALQAIRVFEKIESLVGSDMETQSLSFFDFRAWLTSIFAKIAPLAEIKKHKVSVSELKKDLTGVSLQINKKFLEEAFREIILNAFKFSPENSTLYVLMNATNEKLNISFLNIPRSFAGIKGIPPEYERLVFEPFFRLCPGVDDRYNSLDFGLGLTLASKVFKKHQGLITMSNVVDHFSPEEASDIRVNVQITLPLYPAAPEAVV